MTDETFSNEKKQKEGFMLKGRYNKPLYVQMTNLFTFREINTIILSLPFLVFLRSYIHRNIYYFCSILYVILDRKHSVILID